MRIGLYGGTFDPIHMAHLVLAEQCREQLLLDEVWFVPAAVPPHKQHLGLSSPKHRLAMVELAIAGHSAFRVETVELDRPGPSYTVHTLQELHARRPEVTWFLLMGADSLRDFPTWREPDEITRLATVVAVNRGWDPVPDAEGFSQRFQHRLQTATMPGLDLAASSLRRKVALGESIRYLVPRAVEIYIQQHELYRETSLEELHEAHGRPSECE